MGEDSFQTEGTQDRVKDWTVKGSVQEAQDLARLHLREVALRVPVPPAY